MSSSKSACHKQDIPKYIFLTTVFEAFKKKLENHKKIENYKNNFLSGYLLPRPVLLVSFF